jgi:hypothetical protein
MANRSAGLEFTRNLIGPLDFSDMSGGLCTAYPAHSINNNQVALSLNALWEKKGFSRQPGLLGISATAMFSKPIRGWFVFKHPDGTETYIVISNKVIYSVALTTGAVTSIGTLTSDNECYAVNYYGKLWIVNGVDMVKVESSLSVYNIGIAAPTGFTASGTSTAGTLPIGTYGVYVSYVRQISGINVLYSAPQSIGNVAVDGSHAVRIAVTASSDAQVTHMVAWMTDAGGATPYYYGITTNTTGNFDITSNSNKNANLLMYEQASGNQLPSSLTGIYAFDGRLWGWKSNDNNLYYTIKAQNVYDLERWSTEFHIPTIPFNIYSCHGVGANFIANTSGGMYKLPNADVNSKPEPITQGATPNTQLIYFPKNNIKTIVEYNNGLFGLTNDGFRNFDGEHFSLDLSKHIKPQIDLVVLNSTNFPPAATIYRRSGKRTEYQLSYNDNSINTIFHNRKLVLNLDKVAFVNPYYSDTISESDNYIAPWEICQGGFSGVIVTSSNTIYYAQSSSSSATISGESGTSDLYSYDEAGAFVTVPTARKIYVRTKTMITELAGSDTWMRIYTLATLSQSCVARLIIPDQFQFLYDFAVKQTGGATPPVLDGSTPLIIPFILPAENPLSEFNKMPPNARGNSMYLEFEQTADDSKFFIFNINAYGYHERNAFI